ncbi:MAG: hypothetical protein H0V59_00700, partial [Nocardioidaceae bacterium]|nr:hypothetical protein [Nocardioidaceae bacterium]
MPDEGLEALIDDRLLDMYVNEEARRRYKQISSPNSVGLEIDCGTLREIGERSEGSTWRVAQLIPSDSSAVVVAQRKVGKTTFVLN